jgi:hypothetical protein
MVLSDRVKKLEPSPLISQRIKRIQAITLKLRENRAVGLTMNLSQMQDIGGCRATVSNVLRAEDLVRVYESAWKKNAFRGGVLKTKDDYIQKPKPTGYRGVHFIIKYHSDSPQLAIYNGLQIEIQIRTRVQHYWATAVETVDFFTGQTLKSNIGQLPWKRFFILVANEFARIENRPLIPGAPTDGRESRAEIREQHEREINAIAGMQTAHRIVTTDAKSHGAQLYLLQLDLDARTLRRTAFTKDRIHEAEEKYLQTEMQHKGDPSKQAVLVSVDKMTALPKAYPNFYLDIGAFDKLLSRIVNVSRSQR